MKHEVAWTKDILEKFIEYGRLSDRQKLTMRLRTADNTDIEIADTLNISVPTYYRRIKELKSIYDEIQKEHPEELPPRKVLNEKLFRIDNKDYGIEFINNCNFEKYSIELKLVKKVKKTTYED